MQFLCVLGYWREGEGIESLIRSLGRAGARLNERVNADGQSILFAQAPGGDLAVAETPDLFVILDGEPYLERPVATDEELLTGRLGPAELAALYRLKGMDVAGLLRGAFSFVIHDRRSHETLVARDQLGIKPLFFRKERDRVAIANNLAWLNAGRQRPFAINHAKVLSFLAGFDDQPLETFRLGNRRVAPGTRIRFAHGEAEETRYWRLLRIDVPRGMAAVEAFRGLLSIAVRDGVRPDAPLASMLSGGLDSGAIVSTLLREFPERNVDSYTLTFPDDPALDEAAYVESYQQPNLTRHFLPVTNYNPLAGARALLKAHGELFNAPGAALTAPLYARAAATGARHIFNGHGGDEVLGYGPSLMKTMARRHHLLRLGRLLARQSTVSGEAYLRNYMLLVLRFSFGERLRRIARRLAVSQGRAEDVPAIIAPEVRAETTAREVAYDAAFSGAHDEWHFHMLTFTDPLVAHAFEILGSLAGAHGMINLYPFFDLRLVEFAASVDPYDKVMGGYPRGFLREAMRGSMSDSIRLRLTKSEFGGLLRQGMLTHGAELIVEALASGSPLATYCDLTNIRKIYRQILAGDGPQGSSHVMMLWRVVSLYLWLTDIIDET